MWDSAKNKCELYNLNTDFSEAVDLAAREPERLNLAAAAP